MNDRATQDERAVLRRLIGMAMSPLAPPEQAIEPVMHFAARGSYFLLDEDESPQKNRNLGETGGVEHLIPIDRGNARLGEMGDIHERDAELLVLHCWHQTQTLQGLFEPVLQAGIEAFP